MADRFRITRRVEFAETDMAGIVHFANFFRYMESAEHAFFRALGLSVHGDVEGQTIGFPRVDVSCRYKSPLKFEQEFEDELIVRNKTDKSLTIEHVFRKLADPPVEVARGRMTIVCVAINPADGKFKAVPIPDAIARQFDVAPESTA